MAGQYELKDAGEAWEPFRERIAKDLRLSDASRVRILQLLDDDSICPDTKKWRLENRFGEDTWRYFKKEHFPYLRVVEVRIFYHDVPDRDEPEAPEESAGEAEAMPEEVGEAAEAAEETP